MSAQPHALLTDRGNLKRRNRINRVVEVASTVAALLAVAVLLIVIGSVLVKGIGAINLDFLTQSTVAFGTEGGGIANAIVGTAVTVAVAAAMAIPVGILVAIYTSEFAHQRVAHAIRFVLDVLNGVPTIITAIFILGLYVIPRGGGNGFAVSLALAIIMLPIVARTTQEVLDLVPSTLKEGAFALGVTRWRTVLRVTLPTAIGGILTGSLLAVARVAGETAPWILLGGVVLPGVVQTDPTQPMTSIPFFIFTSSESPSPDAHTQAWAAALVLIAIVLLLNVVARAFHARATKRMGA